MANTAAVLLPDLMRFRKRVDKDAFPRSPWKQDGHSGAGVGNIEIKMNQVMTRHLGEALTKPPWLQLVPSRSLLFLA